MPFAVRTPDPACAAIAALISVQNKGRLALFRIWSEDVHRTNLDADVASVADTLVKQQWCVH